MNGNIRKHAPHAWNVICDVCGRKRKNYEVIMAYGSGNIPVVSSCIDGCADSKHPLNSPPPVIFDGRPVPDARPESSNTYIYVSSAPTIGNFYGQRIGKFESNYKPIGLMTY